MKRSRLSNALSYPSHSRVQETLLQASALCRLSQTRPDPLLWGLSWTHWWDPTALSNPLPGSKCLYEHWFCEVQFMHLCPLLLWTHLSLWTRGRSCPEFLRLETSDFRRRAQTPKGAVAVGKASVREVQKNDFFFIHDLIYFAAINYISSRNDTLLPHFLLLYHYVHDNINFQSKLYTACICFFLLKKIED